MTREIKFRAWDNDALRMYYSKDATHDDANTGRGYFPFIFEIGYKGQRHLELMQFTGLKDKNGKEIYEGDIIVFDVAEVRPGIEPALDNQKGEVTISGGVTIFGQWTCLYCNNKRVIGNIYENPELLEA